VIKKNRVTDVSAQWTGFGKFQKKNKLPVPKIDFANIKVAANPYAAQHRYGDSTCAKKNTC
jgi:hypothetical protein